MPFLMYCREYIKQTKDILFEGDGYSDEWAAEAKKKRLEQQ
jgi:glutamine synthetase